METGAWGVCGIPSCCPVGVLSSPGCLIAERQQEYYRVLQEADSRGECSCFVQLMLEVIRDTLSQFSSTSRPADDLAGAENDQAAAKSDQAARKNDQAATKLRPSCDQAAPRHAGTGSGVARSARAGHPVCRPAYGETGIAASRQLPSTLPGPGPVRRVRSPHPAGHSEQPQPALPRSRQRLTRPEKRRSPGKELRREIRMFCELRPSSWNRKPCSSPPRASREPADPPARSCSRCRHRKERDRA